MDSVKWTRMSCLRLAGIRVINTCTRWKKKSFEENFVRRSLHSSLHEYVSKRRKSRRPRLFVHLNLNLWFVIIIPIFWPLFHTRGNKSIISRCYCRYTSRFLRYTDSFSSVYLDVAAVDRRAGDRLRRQVRGIIITRKFSRNLCLRKSVPPLWAITYP